MLHVYYKLFCVSNICLWRQSRLYSDCTERSRNQYWVFRILCRKMKLNTDHGVTFAFAFELSQPSAIIFEQQDEDPSRSTFRAKLRWHRIKAFVANGSLEFCLCRELICFAQGDSLEKKHKYRIYSSGIFLPKDINYISCFSNGEQEVRKTGFFEHDTMTIARFVSTASLRKFMKKYSGRNNHE